jgi:transketolase
MDNKIFFILFNEILKIEKIKINKFYKAELLALINRLNTLAIIKKAGSGHIGTSFSAMDIFVWTKFFQFRTKKNDLNKQSRNIFFSSKGHDAPALYSVLYSLGIIDFNKIIRLRKINGLDGHPDVTIPGIEANTGSLGMGLSKAKGIVWSKKYLKKKGKVIVITGDGEFQEGQIYESLQTISHQKLNDIIVIIDHNKIQSSQFVKKIIDLKNLKTKIKSFGWHVERCDGHNFIKLNKVFKNFSKIKNKPKLLIADTIKGKGVSFMEHPRVMKKQQIYTWHAGAPNDKAFLKAQNELIEKIKIKFNKISLPLPKIININNKKVLDLNTNIEIH